VAKRLLAEEGLTKWHRYEIFY